MKLFTKFEATLVTGVGVVAGLSDVGIHLDRNRKTKHAMLNAAPNGSPATWVGNLGVTERSPFANRSFD